MVSGSDFPLNQSIEYKQLPQGISQDGFFQVSGTLKQPWWLRDNP